MDLDLALKLANIALVIGVGLYSWIMSQGKATAGEIKTLKDDFNGLRMQVNTLEAQMEHVPSKESVHRLEIAITELAGDMKSLAEVIKGAAHAARRVEEYLLSTEPAAQRSRATKKVEGA
jgi:paraquat-inducible protein B